MIIEERVIKGSNRVPYQLHVNVYKPEKEVTKILHIIHGMTEHIGRYEPLARVLTKEGILVVGFDLRGHGRNDGDKNCATLGHDGWDASLEDIHILYDMIHKEYPNVPYYMLGFSLGSFLLREYLNDYSYTLDGAIIMGTGYQPSMVLSMIITVVKGEMIRVGYDYTSPLIQELSFGTYNKKFQPNRTSSDWLCSDNEQLDIYLNDELCREDPSARLFYDLLMSMKRTGNKDIYNTWNKRLPVLLISGKDDPVGDMSKAVIHVYETMKKANINVRLEIIEKARHDVLHEIESGASSKTIEIIRQFMM